MVEWGRRLNGRCFAAEPNAESNGNPVMLSQWVANPEIRRTMDPPLDFISKGHVKYDIRLGEKCYKFQI